MLPMNLPHEGTGLWAPHPVDRAQSVERTVVRPRGIGRPQT